MKLLLGSILTFFKGGGSFCMAEFLFWQNSYAIFFYLSYFLFVVLILHVKMLEFFGGNLQQGWNCLENFFRGGDFPRHKFSMGNFRRELFPSGNRENFSTGEIYGMI